MQNGHEYETIDEVFERVNTARSSSPPPLVSYVEWGSFSESERSGNKDIVPQANPAYVSNLDGASMEKNVAYIQTESYLEVIG